MASSSSVGKNELSSSAAAKQSSSPDDFEKSRNRLLSSSSSSASSSENHSSPYSPLCDPFGEDEETLLRFSNEIENRNSQNNVPAETTTSSLARDDELLIDKLPLVGGSNSDNNAHLALESPPNQVMERNSTTTTTASTTSPYRIPSHVFKRSKSNTPVEWSLTSNESLFSVHMGNMSFTKEQFLLWRLDDLGTPGEPSPSSNKIFNNSGPLLPPPPPRPPGAGSKSVDARSSIEIEIGDETEEVVPKQSTIDDVKEKPASATAAAVFSPESRLSNRSVESSNYGGKAIRAKTNYEPAAVGMPRKDLSLKENNSDAALEKRFSGAHISRMSGESNHSTKSFAFPM